MKMIIHGKDAYDNILYVDLLNKYIQNNDSDYFKKKLIQTIQFINSQFLSEDELLGSAYDADSEGVEGKYYTWKYKDLENFLGNDFEIFKKKYSINEKGNFEGLNILVENNNIQFSERKMLISNIEQKLLNERNRRTKPFFDRKNNRFIVIGYIQHFFIFYIKWQKITSKTYNSKKNYS